MTKDSVDGILSALDPHSRFYAPAEWKELLDEQNGGYTGIGVMIAGFDRAGARDTYVLSVVPASPAERAGLRFGDRLIAINGQRTTGLEPDVVRDKIRGDNDTRMRLTIERAATNTVETVDLRRGRVPQPSIPDAYILRPGIGYIDMTGGFDYTTSAEFGAAIAKLKRSGVTSLILDLRGNGGGIVDEAVKIAERFLPEGTLILTQRGRSPADNRVWKSTNRSPETMPLVLLVNHSTASAAEILAGALQDHDRAVIVGEKTFGKGLVQSVLNLPGTAGLTLTTARYLTPSGRSVQRDYQHRSRYEYFNPDNTTAEIGQPFYESRSRNGRRLPAGDGIHPDEHVISEREDIDAIDAAFHFVRDGCSGREADILLIGPPSCRGAAAGRRSGERRISSLYLKYYVAMARQGPAAANHAVIESDNQVKKAIEGLSRPALLRQVAAGKPPLPIKKSAAW